MCFKKWFSSPVDTQPAFTGRTVSGIVVGDHQGTENDLAGPGPDFDRLKAAVLERWPDMTYREFRDHNATKARFMSELIDGAANVGPDGMLFFIMDTCHAESSTRNGNFRKRRSAMRGIGYEKVLVFSSSLAAQTSADAQFLTGANGAWHFALIHTIEKGLTYLQWFEKAKALLAKLGFDQIPVIEGPIELQNRLIFEGNVITLQVSTHGGQIRDRDGDEPDSKDEVIYFYDGYVVDDEIRAVLENAKKIKIIKLLKAIIAIYKIKKLIFAKQQKHINMKVKSFNTKREFKDTWLQTVISIISLVFLVLLNVGVLTPDQVAEATPLVSSTLGAISTVIAGVLGLIGVFTKPAPPTA